MKITMVKKIYADGQPCKKCREVEEKMIAADQMRAIDDILIADERDPSSPGMQLAARLGVDRAPFFVVERPDAEPLVYTVYFKFVKEILNQKTTEAEEIKEIMNDNPDLDFL